jgi:sugar phosphate permease
MSDELRKKMEHYRLYIFWLLALGYVVVYFHRLCPAVVALDMMRDLKADGTLLGVLGSAYFYPYAIMQLPAGLLSDSWGPRRSITFFFGIAFIGSLLLALAPDIASAVSGRILVGLGVSMLFVPTMKILAEWFEARRFATMTGILMAMGGIGSLIAASPLAAVSSWIGWRGSFAAVGCLTLFLGLAVWLVVRDTPSELGFPKPDDALAHRPEPIALLAGMRSVATTPAFWPLAGWFFFSMAIFFSFAGLWGGPYLMQVYGLSKAKAGSILSMCALGMIVGSPALSYLSNALFRARKPVLVLSSLFSLAIIGTFCLLTDGLPVWSLYALCLGMGIFTSAIVTIGFTMSKELFPLNMAGTSTGMANLFPFAGGAVFQPVVGMILEANGKTGGAFTVAGYRQGFLALTACGVIALGCSLSVKETLQK